MKHKALGTLNAECSVHHILYVSHCSPTVKKPVNKTKQNKIPYFTELSFFRKYGMKLTTSVTINSR